ncbi:MAG: hypothetical protein JWQ74_288 [Marmoricola sp.]|nr:hypothetical protein [Marmoricola sp.]
MTRPLRKAVLALGGLTLGGIVLAGCGTSTSPVAVPTRPPSGSPAAAPTAAPTGAPAAARTSITINGNEALRWGNGPYGVVLAHGSSYAAASWERQAPQIAAQGATVIAVEDISPAAIEDAVDYLKSHGAPKVALMGGSAGADAILQVASRQPDLADQLVLLSPNQEVTGLGSEPKLIIASADEPRVGVAKQLVASSPGDRNTVRIIAGRAHAQAILKHDDGTVLDLILARLRG